MLKRISITNYLLIDALELELHKGFTTITGETGSGKSILIGALDLAMGGRLHGKELARDTGKRCVIELEVDVRKLGLEAWCEANDLPYATPLILRRQVEPGGRSRGFVNDTPVRNEQLRELGERLVHVHSQHQTLLLNDPRFQLGLVDHVAQTAGRVQQYTAVFHQWQGTRTALDGLREEEARVQGELDYLRFQLDELEGAALEPAEQSTLEQALARAENAEDLMAAYRALEQGVSGEEGLLAALVHVRQAIGRSAKLDPALQGLNDRLATVAVELKDIAGEAERLGGQLSVDPAEALRLRERLDLLLRLQQKHRQADVEALLRLRDDLRTRVQGIGSLADRIAAVQVEERTLYEQMDALARAVSRERREALVPLAEQVSTLLQDLGIPHAIFTFEHAITAHTATGIDQVRALFRANKNRPPAPLDKVASGGELSRVMLALISLAAESKELPTVIFDEIDTGVSGHAADRVGSLMARMARDRQVIAITHLPQIASKADTHLLVSKDQGAEEVTTHIAPVHAEERVQALARMLSGKKMSQAALDNARELLKGK